MEEITLAEALLLRKELNGRVDQRRQIQQANLFEMVLKRQPVNDNVDDIQAQVPKLTAGQVTAEHDFYARNLREVDAVIQQANWNTKVEVKATNLADYVPPTEK